MGINSFGVFFFFLNKWELYPFLLRWSPARRTCSFFGLTEKLVFKLKTMYITVQCISTRCLSWISLDPLFLTACAGTDGISDIFMWTDYITYSICTPTASLHIKFYYEQPLYFNVTRPITAKSRWSQAELWTLKWAMSVWETLVRIIAFHDGLHFFLLVFFIWRCHESSAAVTDGRVTVRLLWQDIQLSSFNSQLLLWDTFAILYCF